MRKRVFSFLVLLLLAEMGSGTGYALAAKASGTSATSRAAADAAYIDLGDAIRESGDEDAQLDHQLESMAQQLATVTPAYVEAEALYPGMASAIAEALRPVIIGHGERVRKAHRPRIIAGFKEVLTEKEARSLAAFIRSPTGRMLMASTADATGVDEGAPLSQQELVQLQQLLAGKMAALTAKVNALQAAMENEPLSAEEEAQILSAFEAAVVAHSAKFAN